MLHTDKIREITFNNYSNFINYAQTAYPFITRQGLSYEELVNEAIINVFDNKSGFSTEATLVDFIKKSIKTIGYHEKELLKDTNFIIKPNAGEEYSIVDRGKSIDRPSDEFLQVYSFLEKIRFGLNEEKKACTNCGFVKFYNLGEWLKCKACGNLMSLTSQTYLHSMNLSYIILYKLVKAVCQSPKTTSYKLSKNFGIIKETAQYRRMLILAAINSIRDKKTDLVFEKLLTPKKFDNNPLPQINRREREIKILSTNDIKAIRAAHSRKEFKVSELTELYMTDKHTIRKIINRKLYA